MDLQEVFEMLISSSKTVNSFKKHNYLFCLNGF